MYVFIFINSKKKKLNLDNLFSLLKEKNILNIDSFMLEHLCDTACWGES